MPLINSTFTTVLRQPQDPTLLDYLERRFPYHDRAAWKALLTQGRLQLDGRVAAGEDAPRAGQTLRFAVVDYEEPEVPLDFRVVETGPDLCLVHKPAGMPVHRTGRIFFQTLANLLREELGDTAWAPLNRLDRETSGLMAFARGAETARDFAPSAPQADWTKLYVAVTRGAPAESEGSWGAPLAELPGDPIRCRMQPLAGGKPALTLFTTLAQKDGLALLVLSPITGRKHQLRAHLAAAGCPVLGDKIYSLGGSAYLKRLSGELGPEDYRELGARRQLLHAFHLRIERGGTSLQAWDWEWGPEFTAHWGAETLRAWNASPQQAAFLARLQAARRL